MGSCQEPIPTQRSVKWSNVETNDTWNCVLNLEYVEVLCTICHDQNSMKSMNNNVSIL